VISPECSADGCSSPVIVQTHLDSKTGETVHKRSTFCLEHHRLNRARLAAAREAKPELKRKRLERRRKTTHERKRADPAVLVSIAAYKRRARLRSKLEAWCTKAYLHNAAIEDERYTKALREWLQRERIPQTEEDRLVKQRQYAKERYWNDPEAARRKSQAFKHSRPDYRAKWNNVRGAREEELSDGTLTRQAIKALLTAARLCPYCGDQFKRSRRSLDHVIPLAKAEGRKLHSLSNVVVCCFDCNTQQANQAARRVPN
jgi:5-methylcytosine-specific restriction endonuclease McrA